MVPAISGHVATELQHGSGAPQRVEATNRPRRSWGCGPDPALGGRRPARCRAALEALDDNHAAAATGAWRAISAVVAVA